MLVACWIAVLQSRISLGTKEQSVSRTCMVAGQTSLWSAPCPLLLQEKPPPKTLSVQMSLTPQLLAMHPSQGGPAAVSASGGRAGAIADAGVLLAALGWAEADLLLAALRWAEADLLLAALRWAEAGLLLAALRCHLLVAGVCALPVGSTHTACHKAVWHWRPHAMPCTPLSGRCASSTRRSEFPAGWQACGMLTCIPPLCSAQTCDDVQGCLSRW